MKDIAVGSSMVFNYPGPQDPCLLLRTGQETLVAYSQSCTHLACAVVPLMEEGRIQCPCHQGYFDLASGRPIAGPPRRPLARILLEVRNGAVYATGIEWRTV